MDRLTMPHEPAPGAETWMARALDLARRGVALASPNPMVGAVLVRHGRVVGEGFHTYDGLRHAEIIALEAAGHAARGATLYINLEPCCHTGRTGPCTQALIAADVARVVAAMPDPNPAVAGRGFRQLRAAGIAVELAGKFQDEARSLNETFAKWIRTRQPFVTLKSAMTLDGQTVLPAMPDEKVRAKVPGKGSFRGKKVHPRWITSKASRAEVQRMRHAADAILTGIGTVLADDPLLTDRTGLPRRRRLLRVIFDSKLRLSPRAQLARTARGDVLVFTCASESSPRARALRRAGVEIIAVPNHSHHPSHPQTRRHSERSEESLRSVDLGRAPHVLRSKRWEAGFGSSAVRTGRVNLSEVLAELARRDVLSVLLETGNTLNDAALEADLVDKVRLFYAPMLAGSEHSAGPSSARRAVRTATRLHDLSGMRIEQFGPDFAVEGYLHNVYRG